MNFLFPQFLFGLLAISIPIAIHLFNLQKPKKVLFPNVKFLKQVQQSTSNKLKLKHLLILLARIAFLVCLVLAFAQPLLVNKDAPKLKGTPYVALYLDNSYSMQNEVGQEKALDVGVKSIVQLTEIFPATTNYGFLSNDFEGRDQFFRNKDKLNERISELNFSSSYRDAASLLKRQHILFEGHGYENKHMVWFSDFQKSTMGDLSKLKFDSTILYHLIPIQNEEISNVAVDTAWLENPLVKSNENNLLNVKVYNSGKKPVRELTLKLYIDNVQVSSTVVDILPESSIQSSFVVNIGGAGQKKAVIRFDDAPVTFDNEYFLMLNVSPKIKILHLYEEGGALISNVFSNESIFEPTNSPVGDFDYSKIEVSDIIVLDAVKNIPQALFSPLRSFVEKGGSLVVVPSTQPDKKSYETLASSFGLTAPSFAPLDTALKSSSELVSPDFANPFFQSIFEKKDPKITMPYSIPSVKWGNRGEGLLRYKNNDLFLSRNTIGAGLLYLFEGTTDERYASFSRHSLFVPLFYKMAFYSIRSSEQLAFSFQESWLSVDMEQEAKSTGVYSLEAKDFSVLPSQWYSNGKLVLDLPKEKMKSGFYDLKLNGKVEKTLAFNYGKKESDSRIFSFEELKKLEEVNKNVKVYNPESTQQFKDTFKNDNLGVPLWKYFLVGALLFLMVEIVLIRFWK